MKNNIIIIGAGIVGLASAYQILAQKKTTKLLLLEKENAAAKHQTGNNSGVIHSGIYYKPGSLKAKNCLHGYNLLLDFCERYNIKYEICGKLIVAVDEKELPRLENLYQRGLQNNLAGLKKLNASQLKEYEPHVNGIAGIFVPQTGIIDFVDVANQLKNLITEMGGEIHLNEKVVDINLNNHISVRTNKDVYKCSALINCAGLYSDKIAALTESNLDVKIIPFRGEYYKLKKEKQSLVKSLIYPVPDPEFPFLGVHFTRMIDGSVEAGPNAVFAFKREGYKKFEFSLRETFDSLMWPGFQKVMLKYWKTGLGEYSRSFSKKAFVKALQKLIPEIGVDDLEEGGSGVRAQACDRTGRLLDDFYIVENKNIFHVCNAPSPAATASLAIGEYIANKVNSVN